AALLVERNEDVLAVGTQRDGSEREQVMRTGCPQCRQLLPGLSIPETREDFLYHKLGRGAGLSTNAAADIGHPSDWECGVYFQRLASGMPSRQVCAPDLARGNREHAPSIGAETGRAQAAAVSPEDPDFFACDGVPDPRRGVPGGGDDPLTVGTEGRGDYP